MEGLRFYRLKSPSLVISQVGGCFIHNVILVQIRFRWRALVPMLPGRFF